MQLTTKYQLRWVYWQLVHKILDVVNKENPQVEAGLAFKKDIKSKSVWLFGKDKIWKVSRFA